MEFWYCPLESLVDNKIGVMNKIVYEDITRIVSGLGSLVNSFEGKRVLITGYKGFLGSNFTAFFNVINKEVLKKKAEIICLDSNIVDLEDQTADFSQDFSLHIGNNIDVIPDKSFDYILHCAGIASPMYYRKYPLETIYVNSIGYWEMLNEIDQNKLQSFLYFSTSEVYGDPDNAHIPTHEDYRGNVSCTGPRACYDESKRLGETISISFVQQKHLPIKIVRPFNVYGPFMRLDDKRVIPDFIKDALKIGSMTVLSNGSPSRSFCYISDAMEGFLRILSTGKSGKPYNIGNDLQEVSILDLANLISDTIGGVKIKSGISEDINYLTDNPQRRCPIIIRAKEELGYNPKINLNEGLQRVISWYKETYFKR